MEGLAGVARHAATRYLTPLKRIFDSRREVALPLGKISVVVPCTSATDLPFVEEQLRQLTDTPHRNGAPEIHVPHGPQVRPSVGRPSGSVRTVAIDNELMLLGYVAQHANIIVSRDGSPDKLKDSILTVADRLGLRVFADAVAFQRFAADTEVRHLKGKGRLVHPTYQKLGSRLNDGQYQFTETLDWDIVQELPLKFEHIARTATLRAVPISAFRWGHGRVARQFAVGRLYRDPYLLGKSVLDVCCDLCGVREFVGTDTRYVGVDIQGLGDYCIDLDSKPLPFEARAFETVLCFESLEHLNDIHSQVDGMLRVASRYFIGSLFVESAVTKGRSVNRFGDPIGNAHLPIAPVFDRHKWIFTFSDALDFIYYRTRRAGFTIAEITLFYGDHVFDRSGRVLKAFKRTDTKYLGRHVPIIGFVAQRHDNATSG